MRSLLKQPIQKGKTYWLVKNNNTGESVALAETHQKAYGFIKQAENEQSVPFGLPWFVTKVVYN